MNAKIEAVPYPGLRPFHYTESDVFFGREEQTQTLLEKLSEHRFISVVGQSGCGKSSLVRAGVIAHLKRLSGQNGSWWVGAMRPADAPLQNLARALLSQSLFEQEGAEPVAEDAESKESAAVLSCLQRGENGLADLLRENPLPPKTNLLIVVDQFEEIFQASHGANLDEKQAFIALLLASVRQTEFPVYVMTTMRSEFLGEVALFQGLTEMMNASQFIVPLLDVAQQRRAIVEPAQFAGGEVDAALVERILQEMANEPDQLPLLQHCMMRIWLRAQGRISPAQADERRIRLTLEDYTAIGGFKNAISHHADETFWKLTKPQQQITERIFRRLADRRVDRRYLSMSASISDMAAIAGVSPEEIIEIIEIFRHPERRFLLPDAEVPLRPDSLVSFSHESLVRQWQQLRAWVEQEARSADIYRHLEQTARLWQHGKAALWQSPDLEHALEWGAEERPTESWAKRYGRDFELSMKFLDASRKRQNAKQMLSSGLLALGTFAILSLAAWGGWEHFQRVRLMEQTQTHGEAAPTSPENGATQGEARPMPAPTAKPVSETVLAPDGVRIRGVILQDANGLRISAARERYLLKPSETVELKVELDNPGAWTLTLAFRSLLAHAKISDARYTAPDLPGSQDVIFIEAKDAKSGAVAAYYAIPIAVRRQ